MKMEEARNDEGLRNTKRTCIYNWTDFHLVLDSVLNTDYALLNLLSTAHRNILTALILECIYLMCVCKMSGR